MTSITEHFSRLGTRLDLPPEVLHGSQVLLSGHAQVTVEGHRGIRRYGEGCIEVRARRGHICVEGRGLQVSYLSAERLCIRGQIAAVRLEAAT